MSHKYYYKSPPVNTHKIFTPNPILDCPACLITPTSIITVYSFNNTLGKKIIKDTPRSYLTGGGGSNTPTTPAPPNKYQIFINSINKLLFDNQINYSNINTYVTSVQNMIDTLKSEDTNYINNPYYIAMMLLLRQLDYEYKIQILQEDLQNLSIQYNIIVQQNIEYTTYCTCGGRMQAFAPGYEYGIVANADISMAYIKYIEVYGVPDDGIFLPSLLNQIKLTYGY